MEIHSVMLSWPAIALYIVLVFLVLFRGSIRGLLDRVTRVKALGIVAKQADSAYRAGRQSKWLKIKNAYYSRREALGFRESP